MSYGDTIPHQGGGWRPLPSMAPTWSPSVVSVVGPVGLFLVLLARGCLAEGKKSSWSGWTWLFV